MKSFTSIAIALLLLVLTTACGGADAASVDASEQAGATLDELATTPAIPADDPADDPAGTVPTTRPAPAREYEGPGTDTVPAPRAPESEAPVEPHNDVEPVYGTTTPTTYRVTGVAEGDVLNVRAAPGAHEPEIATFARDAIDINSTGRLATVGETDWFEVEVPAGTVGWVSGRYLAVQTPSDG